MPLFFYVIYKTNGINNAMLYFYKQLTLKGCVFCCVNFTKVRIK